MEVVFQMGQALGEISDVAWLSQPGGSERRDYLWDGTDVGRQYRHSRRQRLQ